MAKNKKRLCIILTAVLAAVIIVVAVLAVSCSKNKEQAPASGNTTPAATDSAAADNTPKAENTQTAQNNTPTPTITDNPVTPEPTDGGTVTPSPETTVTPQATQAATPAPTTAGGNTGSGGNSGNSGGTSGGNSGVQITDCNKTMYTTTGLNIRSSYSSGSTLVGTVEKDEKVTVTGTCDNGWVRIKYNNIEGFINGNYVTSQKPAGNTGNTGTSGGSGNSGNTGNTGGNSGNTGSGGSSGGSGNSGNTGTSSDITINKYSFTSQSVPNNSAISFVNKMTVGWNLGNAFDAADCTWLSNHMDYEFGWCQVKTSTALIDAVYNAGFNTIRIPVSWHNHIDSNYKISADWLARVTEIVDYAYSKGMYVIIDIHHDVSKDYYYPSSDKLEQSTKYMQTIWKQLANNFSGYGERLIFESINEPRLVGHNNEWWYNSSNADCVDALNCIMKLNQVFVDTVRATGGNNAGRYLMIPSYDTAYGPITTSTFKLPTDSASNKLIVTAHAYLSYNFAGNTSGTSTFDSTAQKENKDCLSQLYNKYVKNGIPVIIGEFGAIDKNNEQDRTNYCSYFVGCAKSYGIRCVIWDNNAFRTGSDSGEKYGLIDRKTLEVKQPNLIQAMMQYF